MIIRVTAKSPGLVDFTTLQELSRGDAIKERSLGKLIALLMYGLGYEYDQVTITKEGGDKT